ncbi:MAG: chorismate mutase [Neisseria sp.]|nr:chorismate mutase [Neisseria sp.]
MIIVMQKQATREAVGQVADFIRSRGLNVHISRGEERTILGAVGDERVFHPQELESLPQVERAIRVLADWRIISRETLAEDSVITVRGTPFGAGRMLDIAAGPALPPHADALYTDPFFIPDNPYAEQGPGEKEQIRRMKSAVEGCHAAGKPVLVRVRDVRQIEQALQAGADILYLGGELMANRALQREVGRLNTPVVICKDKHHLYNEWLAAAEHIALQGNHQIILGESGTLSFEPGHQYRFDTDAVVRVRRLSHLPVLANITRLWHNDMPQEILYRLAGAAGANAVVSTLPPAARRQPSP